MTAECLLVGNRFMHDTALVLVWGGTGFIAFVAPKQLQADLHSLWIRPEQVLVIVALTTAMVAAPINLFALSDRWPTSDIALTYLLDTSTGRFLIVQLVSAFALLVSSMKSKAPATVLLAGLMLCELAMTGHATDGSPAHQVIAGVAQSAHILAGGAWLGALPMFLIVLHLKSRGMQRSACTEAMRKFSTIGHLVVAITLVGGITLAVLIDGFPHLSSTYGRELLLKTSLVVVMALIAVANRYVIVPRLRSYGGASSLLIAGSTLEIVLGIVALALVASFGTIDPV
jgi:putative copper resistance protein D